ncbi:MAG: hypothetical protein HXY46_00720 [Syntrophaceae bacterium]|nr:hypothetical protein [Syntrophaceae bacterium]
MAVKRRHSCLNVGCDQHKKYSFVVTMDENGNALDQVKLYHTDKERMKTYFSSLPQGSVVALESCGFDHWLGDMLEELGMTVKLAHKGKKEDVDEIYKSNICSLRFSTYLNDS